MKVSSLFSLFSSLPAASTGATASVHGPQLQYNTLQLLNKTRGLFETAFISAAPGSEQPQYMRLRVRAQQERMFDKT